METILLITKEKDLEQFFETFSEEEIQNHCPSEICYRGTEYFENNFVSNGVFNADKTVLTAKVSGSRDYTIQIRLKHGTVDVSCTCPYDDLCKHVVAVMMYAANERIEVEVTGPAGRSDEVKKYLSDLSKQELVNLLMDHAPDEFFINIDNKCSPSSEAQKIFSKGQT